jgi:hypothetical protein
MPIASEDLYHDFPEQPQFRALCGPWHLDAKLKDSDFAFTPPKGAEKIRFEAPRFGPAESEEVAK